MNENKAQQTVGERMQHISHSTEVMMTRRKEHKYEGTGTRKMSQHLSTLVAKKMSCLIVVYT